MTTPPASEPPAEPPHSPPVAPPPAAAVPRPLPPPNERAPGKPMTDFKVLGYRHENENTSTTPLWLWGLALGILILMGVKIYLRMNAEKPPEETLHNEAKLLYGTDSSRARALLVVAKGDFTLKDREVMLRMFDDSVPVELSDLTVVVLATHYHLRATPASLDGIQVLGNSSPAVVEYPGGRPTYLEFNEKFQLKGAIERCLAEEEGQPLPAAAPEPAPSALPPAKANKPAPSPAGPPAPSAAPTLPPSNPPTPSVEPAPTSPNAQGATETPLPARPAPAGP